MQQETVAGYRLSPQQERLWRAQQDGPGFRTQGVLLLEGQLDASALHAALLRIVQRHEVLRTLFPRRSGMKLPLQVIHEQPVLEWQTVDLTTVPEPAREVRLAAMFEAEGRRPFDFEHGPLVRATLVALAPQRHLLLLTLSALCADLRSLHNLVRELAGSYAVQEPGNSPVQYADFSEWEHQLLEADDEDTLSGKKFWTQLKEGVLPALMLPFQGPAQPGSPREPACAPLTLDAEISRKVDALAKQNATTPDVLLLACWHALLGRLSGQDEVSVEQVQEGRKQPEFQETLGLYAQVLPIRAHLNNQSFVDFLRQVRDAVQDAVQWQEFFDGTEGAAPGVGFAFLASLPRLSAGELSLSVTHQASQLNRFTVMLSCTPSDDCYQAIFSYDPQLFGREQVERLAGYFERLLAGVMLTPAAPPGNVDILSADEKQQLLVSFNQTAADYPHTKCLHQMFEEQVERTPERLALVFEEQQLTYAQLNARANQLAHALRRRGVGRNGPVGLCLERSADMLIGLLGILKAGGAYVPLHHELPKARLDYQINETRASLVITQEKLLGQLPPIKGEFLCLDRDQATFAQEPQTNPIPINTADDLVYVIYTSGSTGAPKGVAVRHRNLVNYSCFIQNRLGLEKEGAGLHFATVSTLSADLGNTAIFPALISGGCLHVLSYDLSMDGQRFAQYTARHPLDVLKITPSHLSALLAAGEGSRILPRKYLILGGEASSWELMDRIAQSGGCAVINHYGPTETTVGSLTFSVAEGKSARAWSSTVPIGRPIANTQVYILDANGQPAPLGVPGELCIGGAGVAQGYLNQPEQTTERFIKDPFAPDVSARLYRTGDRVRYLPDGNVEFLGRIDQQVKIRGFRVEPAEIESVLRRHAAIHQAAVVAQEDKNGDKTLVGYFVLALGRSAKVEELRAFLLEQLPDYMVPAALVPLESLPLTPNGKLDRRALPDLEQIRLRTERTFVAPRNDLEEKLVSIWSNVLRIDRISIHDDFFELGGHSLMATQVISRVLNTFQVQLPLRTIFDNPTIAGLAAVIVPLQIDAVSSEALDQMLAQLGELSDEEVEQLLARHMEPGRK